eukprot:Colp12_sorted_trinity150504_noHs@35340
MSDKLRYIRARTNILYYISHRTYLIVHTIQYTLYCSCTIYSKQSNTHILDSRQTEALNHPLLLTVYISTTIVITTVHCIAVLLLLLVHDVTGSRIVTCGLKLLHQARLSLSLAGLLAWHAQLLSLDLCTINLRTRTDITARAAHTFLLLAARRTLSS